MSLFPQQKKSKNEKNDTWKTGCVDSLCDATDFYSNDRSDLLSYYRAANGHLDPNAYKHVLNPYNTQEENLHRYPAMMRNFDIISPIIQSYMGEMADKPTADTVIVTNADSVNMMKDDLNKQMYQVIGQMFSKMVQGQDPEVNLQKAFESYQANWNDNRAIFGQEALDYIKYNCDLDDKKQDGAFDWFVSGSVYSFKEPRDNDVHYEVVPPYELWHSPSPTTWVEDADKAVRCFRRSPSALVDLFRHELKPDDITWLENLSSNGGSSDINPVPNIDNVVNNSRVLQTYDRVQNLITVYHCVWKSFKKVGILTYIDALGQQQELEVDETYKFDKENGDIDLEWEWVNEVWEGYRIDKSIYLKIQPFACQRQELNNTSRTKLPYNGRIGYNKHTQQSSVVKQLLPYQAMYNIIHFRGELTLARNKDKIMAMPIGLIPEGWSPEKALWFAESSGIMWFDETKPNAIAVLNAIKGIDLSLGNYIQQIRDLLREIKEEAWDSVGMNRQRYGDVKASDGKGNNEQAIFRSATITRDMFRRYWKFLECDKQGLLDVSKQAWIEGKKSTYITSDGRRAFFEVNPIQHLESCYGIFAKDGDEEQRKLEAAKSLTMSMAQKGTAKSGLMFETLDSNNFSKLKSLAHKMDAAQEQLEQEIAKREQEHAQLLQDKIDKNDAANRDMEIQKSTITANATIEAAQIKAHTDIVKAQLTNENNGEKEEENSENPIVDQLLKAKREQQGMDLQGAKQNQDAVNKDRELSIKEDKAEADIRAKNRGGSSTK